MSPKRMQCPLCQSTDTESFHADVRRPYERCRGCSLVYVPPTYFLSAEAERAHYDLHENDPRDERYRTFLSRLSRPMLEQLPPASRGLDYGSGPGPTLHRMLEEAGHQVRLYDCFYAPDVSVFDGQYDFITASEVLEHLHDPAGELARLWRCLKPGGVLGVMTQLVRDRPAFANWHYIRDPTHVCFFSADTFRWLANHWDAELTRDSDSVALFRKPSPGR